MSEFEKLDAFALAKGVGNVTGSCVKGNLTRTVLRERVGG